MEKITIYTDGGARGNPGPAGIGAVIKGAGIDKGYGEYIGETTNNEAEYRALVFALKKTKSLIGKFKAKQAEIECFLDSELIVKQLNHEYKIENENLQKFFLEVWNLMLDFGRISFTHVRREQNKEADKLLNEALDKKVGQKELF
ncbi:ribonuclease HI family protein [Candidatus Falkowbacteria bacterium]|jgi:ribonuclease HI|nr:ribonuclease HI family protein [Candidatus Falkowbacteria bacterium]MBT4433476.1 ribonuclease HI family protein [Candidatus Falkowbacteria bacterium]